MYHRRRSLLVPPPTLVRSCSRSMTDSTSDLRLWSIETNIEPLTPIKWSIEKLSIQVSGCRLKLLFYFFSFLSFFLSTSSSNQKLFKYKNCIRVQCQSEIRTSAYHIRWSFSLASLNTLDSYVFMCASVIQKNWHSYYNV